MYSFQAFCHPFSVILCISHFIFFVLTHYASSLPLDLLFFHALCHRLVGKDDLFVIWTGETKLILFVGIVQVTCQTFQLTRDGKVTVCLTHHLREDKF